ncbi:hypothetical protein GCM10010969_21220 [Saccharibacillus kuerlensis]|uniref:Hint domain-containing protein n=1 Tax=Saccharibacillus kuerlensis TaxID=459527 RepID=A0ABQ2L2N2_9BACL|nr:hypothetical protein GCM10010969_21220 [Saccharibacillus kuerlensis]
MQTDANGLYQMRARYYNPEIKRFVNRDVLSGSIGNGLTMNRYAYVNGNPVSYIDPFGLSADGATWWQTGLSFAADSLPFVGTFKGIQEVFTGVDMITGQQLSVTDRVATGVGTAASWIPFGKHVGKYVAKEGIEGGAWLIGKLGKESKASRLLDGCNCFTAGTQVKTDQGDKNIEDIQVGDQVLSKDDVTGEEGYKTVTATFNHIAEEIYTIHVGGQKIESTYNHPFWVEGKGWTYVKDLKVGDELTQADGTKLEIEQIELDKRSARVYNMTVDEFHTYFVSDLAIWVHNTNNENCDIGSLIQEPNKDIVESLYKRSNFRKGSRTKAESEAPKNEVGKMICPTCGKGIPDSITVNTKNGPVKRIGYDLDHYPDIWAERISIMKSGELPPTRKEVLDEYNARLRVQCHECNISHKYEGVEGTYKGVNNDD